MHMYTERATDCASSLDSHQQTIYSIYNKCIDTYNTEIRTIFSNLGFNPNQLDGNPKEQIEINQRYM